jgi:hypothetical protein
MKNGYIETMWAIHGSCGLYIGTWLTRKDAIYYHVSAKCSPANHSHGAIMHEWRLGRAEGDRAIKVEITYTV